MVGIYKITSPTGKIYIGQSWNVEGRLQDYYKPNCKGQRKLYNSLICYGSLVHQFEIVQKLPNDITQEILDAYEIFYWQQFKEAGFEMMNLKEPGSKGKNSEESKQKMRNPKVEHTIKMQEFLILKDKLVYDHIGTCFQEFCELYPQYKEVVRQDALAKIHKNLIRDNLPHPIFQRKKVKIVGIKKVYQYSLEGELLKIWPCVKEAEEFYNISCLGGACKQTACLSFKGYRWAYEGVKLRVSERMKNKPLYQYSLTGELIKTWYNIKLAEKELNLGRSLSTALYNKKDKVGEFIWSRKLLKIN